jgi:hypothetical protein
VPIQSAGEPSSASLFVITSTLLGRPELVSMTVHAPSSRTAMPAPYDVIHSAGRPPSPRALDDVAEPVAEDLAGDGDRNEPIAGEARQPARGADDQRALAVHEGGLAQPLRVEAGQARTLAEDIQAALALAAPHRDRWRSTGRSRRRHRSFRAIRECGCWEGPPECR